MSCAAIVNNKLKSKRQKKLNTCKYCNNVITARCDRIICNKCLSDGTHTKYVWKNEFYRIDNLTVAELKILTKNNHRPWTDRIRSYARSRFPAINKICKCGYSKHTEVCHIKPIASFSDSSLIKEINCVENIIYLCPNCHWELDNLKNQSAS